MNRLFAVVVIGIVFVYGYFRGFESGKEAGETIGVQKAMRDLGMSEDVILSQTT